MKLQDGQKWKQRNGDIATVVLEDGYRFFNTDTSTFLYTDEESEDGVFYVFDADLRNGYDLVELVE